MRIHYSYTLRTISIIILAFFTWSFGGVFEVAYAVKESSQPSTLSPQRRNITSKSSVANSQPQPKKDRPEEKFSKAIDDIESIIKDEKTDHETKKQRIRFKKAEIDLHDIEIRKQFTETEGKLKDLPEVIKKRHRDFVKHYDDNLLELKANLDDIERAKTDAEKEQAHRKAKDFLERVKPPKRHQTLDPNKLPHRTEEPVWKEPRTRPEEFTEGKELRAKGREQKPILLAANGPIDGLLSANTQYNNTKTTDLLPEGSYQIALANPPTNDDLAENGIEIVFTSAIIAKAAELGNKPVKIYEWVRNNIEYVPTYGSIQGADMCLQTKLCNDFDTASLLISLLRVSGVHARYVYGTIELPIDKVKNWVGGFTDSMAAINIMASGGVPVRGITEGGKIVSVRKEHMWAEAWIDYIPSRGEIHRIGDTWIPLDASFKQYNYKQGIDIRSAVPFDAQTLLDQIETTGTINETTGYLTNIDSTYIQQSMTDYQMQVQNYISQNNPNATIDDVLGKKEIVKQEFPILLGTLPYNDIATGAKYSSLPDALRHKVTFNVTVDNISYAMQLTRSLPEIGSKKITLSYVPATSADQFVISSYFPKPHVDGTPIQLSEMPTSMPAYLISLKPELRIDGSLVATGNNIQMGQDEFINISISGPTTAPQSLRNKVRAGEYNAFAFDTARITAERMTDLKIKLETTKAKLEAQNFAGLTRDDILGDVLYATVLSYFAELDTMDYVSAKTMSVFAPRLPSVGRLFNALTIDYVFGMPVKASPSGLQMDIGLIRKLVRTPDGTKDKQLQFMKISGMNSSALEHSVPEQLFSTPDNPARGVSAVKALEIANEQGMPIYTIDQTNINTILPQLQLSQDVVGDIQNAVNAGKIVTVSKTNVSLDGWTGCGYIIVDPNTGAGAYMIGGGMNGAWYNSKWVDIAWTVGYYELFWLSKLGEAALAALSAIVFGPFLYALEGIIASAVVTGVNYLVNCVKKAIAAGTGAVVLQQILDIPKRIGNALDKGFAAVIFSVSYQLLKIWNLTCGLPG